MLKHAVKEARRNKDRSYVIAVECQGKRLILEADGIVCAITATAVPSIFPDLGEQQKDFFAAIRYSSAALIARTYKQEQTLGDKGIAFPRQEGIELSSITLSPEPGVGQPTLSTLKTYTSGTIGRKLCDKSDSTIIQTLTTAMEPARSAVLIGNPEPLAINVQRWPEALPLFDVGHFNRLQSFENGEIEDQSQPIVFAGDYIGGPFMEGAFTSGLKAAKRLITRLAV